MIRSLTLSANEKRLFLIVGIVVGLVILDSGARWCQGVWVRSCAQKAELQRAWEYSSVILSRAESIDDQYSEVQSSYPRLFESVQDSTGSMAELDKVAKNAGVKVDMMRPVQRESGISNRYEMSLRGSWLEVMKFLQETEDSASLFSFPLLRIHRQGPSGELVVSAEAERIRL